MEDELELECLQWRPVRIFLRYAALFTGCLATSMAFCTDAFIVYSDTLRETFNFSQRQMDFIIGMAHLGLISSLPAGLIVRRYDPRWLSGAAFIVSTISSALILGSTYHVEFYKQYFFALGIFYFILGGAGGAMYLLAMEVNLNNFSSHSSSTVSGLMHGTRSIVLGSLLLAYHLLYGRLPLPLPTANVTTVAPVDDEGDEGTPPSAILLRHFFLFMLILYAGVNFLACMLYSNYHDLVEEEPDPKIDATVTPQELIPIRTSAPIHSSLHTPATSETNLSTYSSNGVSSGATTPDTSSLANLVPEDGTSPSEQTTICYLLGRLPFHLLMWAVAFGVAMRNVYVCNFSLLLASFHLEYAELTIYAVPAAGLVGCVIVGFVADIVASRDLPQAALLMSPAVIMTALFLLSIGWAGLLPIQVLGLVSAQLGASSLMTLGPSLLRKLFDHDHFPGGWGTVTAVTAVLTVSLHAGFVLLYDLHSPAEKGLCLGLQCYMLYFVITSVLAYFCCVFVFFLILHQVDVIKA